MSIGNAGLATAAPAQVHKTRTQEAPAAPAATTTTDSITNESSAESLSALSSATARVGDQLQAQADAARVQRAAGEAPPPGDPPPAEQEAGTQQSTAAASTGAAGGGARVGGVAAAGDLESTDYIAEADTNSDKTVSDQERIAYENKLAQQAEAQSSSAADSPQDQSREVQKAYGLAAESAPTLSATA